MCSSWSLWRGWSNNLFNRPRGVCHSTWMCRYVRVTIWEGKSYKQNGRRRVWWKRRHECSTPCSLTCIPYKEICKSTVNKKRKYYCSSKTTCHRNGIYDSMWWKWILNGYEGNDNIWHRCICLSWRTSATKTVYSCSRTIQLSRYWYNRNSSIY